MILLRRIFKNSDLFTEVIFKEDDFGYYDKVPMFSKNQIRASMPKVIDRILSVNYKKSRIEYTQTTLILILKKFADSVTDHKNGLVITYQFFSQNYSVWRLWQYGLWSFQSGVQNKNQHTRRKLLNFDFWIDGEFKKHRASF